MSRMEAMKKSVEDMSNTLLKADMQYLINRVEELEKENKRYKQALEFYADFYKYNYGGDKDAMKQVSKSIITEDGGEVARQALEEPE